MIKSFATATTLYWGGWINGNRIEGTPRESSFSIFASGHPLEIDTENNNRALQAINLSQDEYQNPFVNALKKIAPVIAAVIHSRMSLDSKEDRDAGKAP
jgi:hypothetical protein